MSKGKGVLKSGLDHILSLGKRALLADSTVYEIAGRQLKDLKARSAFVHYGLPWEASDT